MNHLRLLAAAPLAALLSLAACQSEPETVGEQTPDPMAEELKNAPPVELPPSMLRRIYRCADNSVVYVDFASDGSYAMIGASETARTRIVAAEPDRNYTGGDYTVSANADDTRIKAPGKSEQSCRAHDR